MDDPNKLWVIDLGDDLTIEEAREKQHAPIRNQPRPVMGNNRQGRKVVIKTQAPPIGGMHFAFRLALTYLMGPFSMLIWSRGSHPVWTALSLLSGVGTVGLALKWNTLLTLDVNASLLVPVLGAAIVVSMVAFTVWARALHLAFTSRTRSPNSWPLWMRTSWSITALGLMAPGLGLYLAGSRRRAVVALWLFWPVFLAAVILAHAGGTWQWLQSSLHNAQSEAMFEYTVLGAAGILALGLVGWLVQALAGLHQRSQTVPGLFRPNGDRYAAALLVAVVSLAIFAQPGDLASFLNDTSAGLQEQGYRTIPLQLARTAYKLDPGETAYGVQVASLHQELGDTDEAARVQRGLDRNLEAYVGTFGERKPARTEVSQLSPETARTADFQASQRVVSNPWTPDLTFTSRKDRELKPSQR